MATTIVTEKLHVNTVGIFELLNAHECGFWRNCVGGAMLVGGAVLERFFVKREDDAKNGNDL